jgi:hypothetical protein
MFVLVASAFGQLKIVISRDIGGLGPSEGIIFYDWKWYYSALSSILWIATFVALVGIKANRKGQAWLVFIPVLVVYLVWTIFKKVVGADTTQMQMFNVIIDGLIFGQAIMWLLAGKLSSKSRFINCLVSLVVMTMAGAGAIVSSLGTGIGMEWVVSAVALALLSLAIVAGQALAGRMCSRKYSILKFSLLTALWEIVIVAVSLLVYGVAIALFIMSSLGVLQAIMVLAGVAFGAGFLGAIVYGVTLPFLILVQRNHFWRQRFMDWAQVSGPQPVIAPPM